MSLVNNPGGINIVKFQQTIASTVWTIEHNLNVKPALEVQVWEGATLMKAFPDNVSFPSANTVVVHWSIPRTGFATLA